MVFRPVGILDEKRVHRIVTFLEREEERAKEPFNRYSDLSRLDAVDLDFGFVFRIALHRRIFYEKRSPIKSAFYVTSPAAARVVKIHAMVTDLSPIKVQMFKHRAEAAKWLDVSLEALDVDTEPA